MPLNGIDPFGGLDKLFSADHLRSRTFARLFFVSALLCLAMIPPLTGLVDIEHSPTWQRLLWSPVVLGGAPGALFIWSGMLVFWMRLDRSDRWTKRGCFLVLLIGFWYGACLYYFFVYLPQWTQWRRSEA
jgi:hypothetical protein